MFSEAQDALWISSIHTREHDHQVLFMSAQELLSLKQKPIEITTSNTFILHFHTLNCMKQPDLTRTQIFYKHLKIRVLQEVFHCDGIKKNIFGSSKNLSVKFYKL